MSNLLDFLEKVQCAAGVWGLRGGAALCVLRCVCCALCGLCVLRCVCCALCGLCACVGCVGCVLGGAGWGRSGAPPPASTHHAPLPHPPCTRTHTHILTLSNAAATATAAVTTLLLLLEQVFNGGSDFNTPVTRCLDRLHDAKWANSDILLVRWAVG